MSKRKTLTIAAALALVLLGAGLIYAAVRQATSSSAPVPTSIAVPQAEPPREVKSILTNDDGDLIITYTDGTLQNAGRVVGKSGNDGTAQAPTEAQISAAVLEYCASGRCDSKSPTQAQILEAIAAYCAGGICKGGDGRDAPPITAEQILSAVTSYCHDGRCKGADGQSVKGDSGESPVMNCVVRKANAGTVRYVAWKYATDADSAYRDLYKLPTWAECTNPVDLTAGGT